MCTWSHAFEYSSVIHRLTHLIRSLSTFRRILRAKKRQVDVKDSCEWISRRNDRCVPPRAKMNRGERVNVNSRPSDIAGDYWVTGIKIGGTPKTGVRGTVHTSLYRRINGGRGQGRGRMPDRLPELWSRRSTAFGRVLKCVISDRDLSLCLDYATSSAFCPRRYALRNRVLDAGSKVISLFLIEHPQPNVRT